MVIKVVKVRVRGQEKEKDKGIRQEPQERPYVLPACDKTVMGGVITAIISAGPVLHFPHWRKGTRFACAVRPLVFTPQR